MTSIIPLNGTLIYECPPWYGHGMAAVEEAAIDEAAIAECVTKPRRSSGEAAEQKTTEIQWPGNCEFGPK